MAFMGVVLGVFAHVAAEQGMFAGIGFGDASAMDPEMGLPVLLRTVLPVGLMGLLIGAYFSAIMSTADSCLLAASGNVLSDMLAKTGLVARHSAVSSRVVTLSLGAAAVVLALSLESVLAMMLYSYAFMVSGLLVPVVAILVGKTSSPTAALAAMLTGGTVTVSLSLMAAEDLLSLPWDLDANAFGLAASVAAFLVFHVRDSGMGLPPSQPG
jgi:SSS family solute:Na+ symporter